MKIRVTYCTMWNYLPKAASLADELRKQFAIEPELVRGSNGIFDVEVDGRLIFSKHKLGRFPETGEVVNLLQEKVKK